jgi:hypothetical protein
MMMVLMVLALMLIGVVAPPKVAAVIPALSPVSMCAVGGAVAAAIGVGLMLGADRLATQWQPLGNGAWGGTTDPSLEGAYRLIGLAVLVFGLVLEVVAAARWVGTARVARG